MALFSEVLRFVAKGGALLALRASPLGGELSALLGPEAVVLLVDKVLPGTYETVTQHFLGSSNDVRRALYAAWDQTLRSFEIGLLGPGMLQAKALKVEGERFDIDVVRPFFASYVRDRLSPQLEKLFRVRAAASAARLRKDAELRDRALRVQGLSDLELAEKIACAAFDAGGPERGEDLVADLRDPMLLGEDDELLLLLDRTPGRNALSLLVATLVRNFQLECHHSPSLRERVGALSLERIEAEVKAGRKVDDGTAARLALIQTAVDDLRRLEADRTRTSEVMLSAAWTNVSRELEERAQMLYDAIFHLGVGVNDLRDALNEAQETQSQEHRTQSAEHREINKQLVAIRGLLESPNLARVDRVVNPLEPLDMSHGAIDRVVSELWSKFEPLIEKRIGRVGDVATRTGTVMAAAGEFERARQCFGVAAREGEAALVAWNSFQVDLALGELERAKSQLETAVKLDRSRFEPFPFARYRLDRILGVGGTGTTFLCEDRQDGGRVVLKTFFRGKDLGESVFREIDAARRVVDPRVVKALHHGFADEPGRSRPYVVMEHAPGLDGERFVKETSPAGLPIEDALAIAVEIADALSVCHANGVVHLDVKPTNVVIIREPSGRLGVKLVDFGLAQVAITPSAFEGRHSGWSRSLMWTQVLGTLGYASPEQTGRSRGPLTAKCDLYGLGKTTYWLLTGQDPLNFREGLLPKLRLLRELVVQLVEPDPMRRPSSAREVARRLRGIREGIIAASASASSDSLTPPAVVSYTKLELARVWLRRLADRVEGPDRR